MNVTNTRRTLLKVATALGAGSFVAVGAAQDQDESDDTDPDIELGGEETGWQGVSPEEIEAETNPTLELAAGEEYVLEWENLDGVGHNFVIEDDSGEDLVDTEITTSGTQTVEFTASEEMAEYYCQPHPTSMRGDIEIVEGTDDEDGTEESDEIPADFAAPVTELYSLTLDGDGWRREAAATGGENGTETDEGVEAGDDGDDQPENETQADQSEGGDDESETNPTLELEAGSVYVLRVINELEAQDVADGEDDEDAEQDGDEADTLEGDVQRQPAELVVFDEDDEAVVRSDVAESGGGSAAVVFVATDDLAGYRDEETEAEGELEVREGEGDDEGSDETDDGGDV